MTDTAMLLRIYVSSIVIKNDNSGTAGRTEEVLEQRQEFLKSQRESVKDRLKTLAVHQSEIARKSLAIKERVVVKYQEIQAVLDEDLRITLSHLDMEELAAVSALDVLMERNSSLIQDIEQDLARVTVMLHHMGQKMDTASFLPKGTLEDTQLTDRVMNVLNSSDPSAVTLDEVKSEQILDLTSDMLSLICSRTPLMKKLVDLYASEVTLDPDTAHPKLAISPLGDRVTYTDTWSELPDLPERFDSTLNVLSSQAFGLDRHYWEIDVTGKTYWELGVTYPSIPRKGTSEACWLGRGVESWCVEFFNGNYTAWHAGVPRPLPATEPFSRIGILCSFPAGTVTFLDADTMIPLFCFCAGTFSDRLHLALCPGHDQNGINANPMVILNNSPTHLC
ncbi:zinc-binding protein A33-like [Neosynchiropus ocellatus]